MLLITLTINGTDFRISNEYQNLTHFWDRKVMSFTQVRYSTAKKYGGGVFPIFGTLVLDPTLFDADWEPPVSCAVKVEMTATTEAAAVLLFEGTAHRSKLARDSVTYVLKQVDDSTVQTISFTGYLKDEFATACTTLGLTLDFSNTTRAATLDTQYTPSGERDLLAALSDLATFFSHYFWIEGSTLYLADCLDNLSTVALTEFDILPSTYKDNPAYTIFKSGDFSVDGSYTYGQEYNVSPECHTTQADVEAALTNIKGLVEKSQFVISAPLELSNIPKIGDKITLTDESLYKPVDIEMTVRSLIYNFDNYSYVIEGEGSFV